MTPAPHPRRTRRHDDRAGSAGAPSRPPLATRQVHGHRRAPRRRRVRSGRDRRPLDRCRIRGLAGVLHQRRPGWRGPRRRPARPGGPARDGAARGRGRHRLRRGQLPPPAGRRPRQRPGAARAARPRDPDVPPGRGARHRSRDDHLQGRRDQPHRPPSGRHRRDRRGLPGGAQPDGLPVAGARRARLPQGPAGLPLLVGPQRHLGRYLRHARAQDRGAPRPRQPDPRPRRPGRADPVMGRRGRRADRGDRGRGVSGS